MKDVLSIIRSQIFKREDKKQLKGTSYSRFFLFLIYIVIVNKKSHTCEEGGGTPQNVCLAFIDELEKQLSKWANKKCKNFNIYNVVFL